ncbi:MAG: LPS export ABC transporter periplasmic protein LptC [Pseudolabrys sp.]|nr:LPS export ABC transporter periplasmic protein LptC [Pseudolabrys sp.]
MTATHSDPAVRGDWATSRSRSGEGAFRAARRHSRLVRALRVALPAALAFIAVAVVLVSYFNPLRMFGRLPVDIGNLVVAGTKITMEQPRLSGFTRDARAYELSAEAAAQDMTKPDLIELNKIQARVELQDKSTVEMSALSGVYDSKAEILKLDKDILLRSSAGYEGRLSEATIDIRKGHVVSEHPVELKLLQGTLDARRLEIRDSGDLIRFDGGVRLVLMLNGAVDRASVAPAAPAGTSPQ